LKKPNRPISTSGAAQPSSLALEVRDAIRRGVYGQPFCRAGDTVGVAVSGGADSVALLRLLLELRDELGVTVCVVHLNHQLRGRAADADERFVARLSKDLGLECFIERVDVAARAKREKLNVEDAARRARFDYFGALVHQRKITRVATAHTADDQAETVLAHILRGSGLAGIAGIHPVGPSMVRPLLGIRRGALRVYLGQKKQTWREDATNRDTTKQRARIRRKLVPLLEKQFQSATVEHLCRLAELAREDNEHLDVEAESRIEAAVRVNADGLAIDAEAIADRLTRFQQGKSISQSPDLSVSRRMVRFIVKDVKPQVGELGSKHVEAVLALAESGENGKSLQLPGGVEVRRHRDELWFRVAGSARRNARSATHDEKLSNKEFEYSIDFADGKAAVSVQCLARDFRFTTIDWPEKSEETNSNGSVFNHEALCKPLVLRNWRPGDTFQPLGHRKPHKLKRLLNEKRISRWDRDGWPVLTSAGVIAWARGFPVGAAFAATGKTKAGVRIEECASSS
jgi:tRNA(Ile)-lysidine synthase